ncbi:MAG TPA: BTAD domain-containing putative transcriptional regulator [Ktedonobacteraceae bacterium]|nr:BTAD domain-containing putative transcriptional regulator [Ktedonobacteraceae bacterium]
MLVLPEMHLDDQDDNTLQCPDTSTIRYRAYFFGPFRLFLDDQPLGEPWRRNKAKSLLKWFLLNPGKFYSAEQLIDLFWADFPPDAAMLNLHVSMHHLRHVLEPSMTSHQKSSFLHRTKHNFYWFELDPSWWVDVISISHLYATAREFDQRGEYDKAVSGYRQIVTHCGRGFLPEDIYEKAFTPYLRQYECAYMAALEQLIHIAVYQHAFNEVLMYSHCVLALDPYCESAMSAVVNAYLQQGNVAGAICKLNDFLRLLKQDLNIGPSQDLLLLREKLMAAC